MKTVRLITARLAIGSFLLPLALVATAHAGEAAAGRGRAMWNAEYPGKGGRISCASCHTADPKKAGTHMVTGKGIEPMSPSVNPVRLTDPRNVEKWFKRNCKDVLARECTAAEKADFLAFISGKQ